METKVRDLKPNAALSLIIQREERWWEEARTKNELDSVLQLELCKCHEAELHRHLLSEWITRACMTDHITHIFFFAYLSEEKNLFFSMCQ